MIAYLRGPYTFKSPTDVIIEAGGVGYRIHISLHTYSQIQNQPEGKLFTYFHVKEDSHTLYGFADQLERELFVHLISVSGIGPATGRMVLSSYTPAEIQQAIVEEDVPLIKSIKGIGPKSAQRIVLELKDKVAREMTESNVVLSTSGNTHRQEALSALILLGFNKSLAEKAIVKVLQSGNISTVEQLIKKALKVL